LVFDGEDLRIKRLIGELVVLSVVPLFCAAPAFAGATSFWLTTLHLNKDASLDVVEEIHQDFSKAPEQGFFRIIPENYTARTGAKLHMQLLMQDVQDEKGDTVPFEVSHVGDDLKLRIGKPSQTITGERVYKIHYIARGAVDFSDKQPEIYWNAFGPEWPYPVTAARIILMTPQGVDLSHVGAQAWSGPPGSTTKVNPLVVSDGVVVTAENLAQGDELTLAVRVPAGSIATNGFLRELTYFFDDWWPALLVPGIAGACMWLLWWAGGRDRGGGMPVLVEWNPPSQLTPAEVGTLVDEFCDIQDVISILIDLAVRGYIKIKETPAQEPLFFSDKDYLYTKQVAPSSQPLTEYERLFMSGVFGTAGDGTTVRLSDLKNHFYLQLPGIKRAIYRSLTNKQLFLQSPDQVRSTWVGLGAVAMFFSIPLMSTGHVASGLGMLAAGLIVAAMANAMPAKTAAGSKAARDSLGFARFVKTAEKSRLHELIKDDPTIFGRLLPYALVLGSGDQWAGAFKDIVTSPPDWYEPAGPHDSGYVFSSTAFVHDLGGGLETAQQAFSAAPATSGTGSQYTGGGFGSGSGGAW
jgi:hypothetical protein